MKTGLYRVYLLLSIRKRHLRQLGRQLVNVLLGKVLFTVVCRAKKKIHMHIINMPTYLYMCTHVPYRMTASCMHVSELLHALLAMSPAQVHWVPCPSRVSDGDSESQEPLPITSFVCQWKMPHKRKESTVKITEFTFQKHVYGRTHKHTH